ncbi:MAG: hypothetical protein QXV17_10225 [Candidatus Micrarchaeaceae archaeon]
MRVFEALFNTYARMMELEEQDNGVCKFFWKTEGGKLVYEIQRLKDSPDYFRLVANLTTQAKKLQKSIEQLGSAIGAITLQICDKCRMQWIFNMVSKSKLEAYAFFNSRDEPHVIFQISPTDVTLVETNTDEEKVKILFDVLKSPIDLDILKIIGV